MHPLHALLLGIVEGITEFLPISSTGHLILASALLHLPDTDFLKSFEIIIQLGAILAVVILYGQTLIVDRAVLLRVLAAFVPTGIIGLLIEKIAKRYLIGNVQLVLWALFLGGIILLAVEYFHKEKNEHIGELAKITYTQAVIIGIWQAIAIIPGVSRSGATIVGGLLLGLKRKTIVDFSFLLAIPTMIAATGLDLVKSAGSFSSSDFGLLAIGFVTSFAVAYLVIRWLLIFIKTHSFKMFGWYRIGVAVVGWVAGVR